MITKFDRLGFSLLFSVGFRVYVPCKPPSNFNSSPVHRCEELGFGVEGLSLGAHTLNIAGPEWVQEAGWVGGVWAGVAARASLLVSMSKHIVLS